MTKSLEVSQKATDLASKLDDAKSSLSADQATKLVEFESRIAAAAMKFAQ